MGMYNKPCRHALRASSCCPCRSYAAALSAARSAARRTLGEPRGKMPQLTVAIAGLAGGRAKTATVSRPLHQRRRIYTRGEDARTRERR